MVPRKHIPPGVKVFDTMNARVEGISSKRSFRSAWTKLQLALIPCEHFYEPDYETGKAVRWRIGLASGEPLAIAGLWRSWKEPEGGDALSFTRSTLTRIHWWVDFTGQHPKKRSVVIVPAAEHAAWLASRSTDEAYSFLRLFPADELHDEPYPLPLRAPRAEWAHLFGPSPTLSRPWDLDHLNDRYPESNSRPFFGFVSLVLWVDVVVRPLASVWPFAVSIRSFVVGEANMRYQFLQMCSPFNGGSRHLQGIQGRHSDVPTFYFFVSDGSPTEGAKDCLFQ
jgi:hypothetical protein